MRGSKNDHYRYPLCSLFFGRGRELSLGGFKVIGVSDVERGAK